jgi:hypothetical protein
LPQKQGTHRAAKEQTIEETPQDILDPKQVKHSGCSQMDHTIQLANKQQQQQQNSSALTPQAHCNQQQHHVLCEIFTSTLLLNQHQATPRTY